MRTPRKYVQGRDSLLDFYQETSHMGKCFLFIMADFTMEAIHDKTEKSFGDSDTIRFYEHFNGLSSIGEIERFRGIVRDRHVDVVVGVGGGAAMDTAKCTAYKEGLPVVEIPTVVATDAPCTGLSVIYNDDASFNSYLFYPNNPDIVIVDTEVIANAPVHFLVSGMGDALSTWFEARHCWQMDAPSLENGGITRSAMALCKLCWEVLQQYGVQAKTACEKHIVTPALEAVVEANVYLSGVGADNGGLCAAHSFYNGVTSLGGHAASHGDCVAFGTLIQLVLEGAKEEDFDDVLMFLSSVDLPLTLEDLHLSETSKTIRAIAEAACKPGESIHNLRGGCTPQQMYDAILAADAIGKDFIGADCSCGDEHECNCGGGHECSCH